MRSGEQLRGEDDIGGEDDDGGGVMIMTEESLREESGPDPEFCDTSITDWSISSSSLGDGDGDVIISRLMSQSASRKSLSSSEKNLDSSSSLLSVSVDSVVISSSLICSIWLHK